MTPAKGPRAWFRLTAKNGPRRVRFCTFGQAMLTAKMMVRHTGATSVLVQTFVPDHLRTD